MSQLIVSRKRIMDALAAVTGGNLIGFSRTESYDPSTIGRYLGSIAATPFDSPYAASGGGVVDDTTAIQNCVNANTVTFLPPVAGGYKTTAEINIPAGHVLIGAGKGATQIKAHGCNAIKINGDYAEVGAMTLIGYTTGGAIDPKTYDAIVINGASGAAVNEATLRALLLRGWAKCVHAKYTWQSRFQDLSTVNADKGIYLWGQSVNNAVEFCNLVSNSGVSSIETLSDGGIIGEGLNVTNTLMSSGSKGLWVRDGFLSLKVANSTIDLISGIGVDATDCRALGVSNCWIYAASAGVKLQPLGTVLDQGAQIIANTIETTAAASFGVSIHGANKGVAIVGGSIKTVDGGRCVYIDGQHVQVDKVHLINPGSVGSIYVNGDYQVKIGTNTGNASVDGYSKPLDQVYSTWTASDQSAAGLTLVQNTAAKYTRVGNNITGQFDVTYPATASSAQAEIALPLAAMAGTRATATIGFNGAASQIYFASDAGGSTLKAYITGGAICANANISNARIVATVNYQAA